MGHGSLELLRLEGNTDVWGASQKKVSQTNPLVIDASAHLVTVEEVPRSPQLQLDVCLT